jgi:hypothetical protein
MPHRTCRSRGVSGASGPHGATRTVPLQWGQPFPSLLNGNNNSTFIAVGDLAGMNCDSSNHQITVPLAGRSLAVAQVHITNPVGVAVRGWCKLRISDGTGPQNGLIQMGVREATWYTVDNAAYDLTVPIVGYAVKPAAHGAFAGATEVTSSFWERQVSDCDGWRWPGQKRVQIILVSMSALGQKQTCAAHKLLGPKGAHPAVFWPDQSRACKRVCSGQRKHWNMHSAVVRYGTCQSRIGLHLDLAHKGHEA